MGELERIRAFVAAVRRRVLLRHTLQRGAAGLVGILAGLMLLAVCATRLGPAAFWFPLTLTLVTLAMAVTLVLGVWLPVRALRDDRAAARQVARLRPALTPLAYDLVSAVELDRATSPPAATTSGGGGEDGDSDLGGISSSLVRAFHGKVAKDVEAVDPRQLVPLTAARNGAFAVLGAAALLAGGARLAPDTVGRGLRHLFHRPTLFEGATVATGALVGDVRITYEYPPYTGLPARVVDGSTGDVVAVKGTRVKLETRPLRAARRAALLLGDRGEGGELPARVQKGVLTLQMTLNQSGSYRFWLQPVLGRAVREDRSHRLEAESDRPPRVEIHGPADRLDLPTPRPIEIGYAADDDFGLGTVELVYRIDEGPEQRELLKNAQGARTAQARTVWDPSRLPLSPGSRIAYRIEARDRDEVSGAKIGSSRTLYLVIARPQQSLDERLDHQHEVLERLIGDLANRLELGAETTTKAPSAEPMASVQRARLLELHESEEGSLALLGQVIDEDRRQGGMSKSLRAALSGMADRLGKLLKEEKTALDGWREGTAKAASSDATARRLAAIGVRHVAELEKDVLLLDDLIGRQRLEDLAALGKELTDAHQRLQDLLQRYAATKDEGLRRQLEREVRDLRARIAELASKIASLKSRNDVPEEWRNMPDAKQLAEKARKLDDLLAQGNPDAISKALSELGKDIEALREMLDDSAEGFGRERFPQENRVVAELMKKVGDLEGDQRQLAGETQELADKQEAELERKLRGQLADWLRKQTEKVARLRSELDAVPTKDPESAFSEEVERARDSARQLDRLFAEPDLAQAKGEAERATGSVDRARDQLEKAARRGRPEASPSPEVVKRLGDARAIADEIARDIEKLLPKADESLSPEERERARGQGERQGDLQQRTGETAREAARRLGKMPGLENVEDALRGASEQMRDASEHLRKGEAKQAGGAQRNAAERLAKLRQSLQERTLGSGEQKRDPVRIPGADESSAPRAWRQELLDAMKEKAPDRFRDDVRRYYEELVR